MCDEDAAKFMHENNHLFSVFLSLSYQNNQLMSLSFIQIEIF